MSLITLILCLFWVSQGATYTFNVNAPQPTSRDPLEQPFASWSIWNLPIGSESRYVNANLVMTSNTFVSTDQEIILLDNSQPLTDIMKNTNSWTGNYRDRCPAQGASLGKAPLPPTFFNSQNMIQWPGNQGVAILMKDGVTIRQTQPLSHCQGSPFTAGTPFIDVNLYTDGIKGAHGGSGLNTLGGTIRFGELMPDSKGVVLPVRHALKLNLNAATNYYPGADWKSCFRWPADGCDGYAHDGGDTAYGGKVPQLMVGALLAIPKSVDINSLGLTTAPGKALAWTLQNYGGYICDDIVADKVAIPTEVRHHRSSFHYESFTVSI